jgi:RND superfamily putative drug exporter
MRLLSTLFATDGIARASARKPWLVIAAWLALVAAGAFFAMGISDVVTTEEGGSVQTESDRALRLIERRLRPEGEKASEQVIVQSDTLTVDDAVFRAKVDEVLAGLRQLGTVETATSYYELKGVVTGEALADVERLVSADRHTTIVPAVLTGDVHDAEDNAKPVIDLTEELSGGGFQVITAGEGSISRAWVETSEKDLSAEFRIGLPIAIVILIVVFGTLAAAGVPVAVALLSIIIATGASALIGRAFELSTFVTNMITMIGLAVGIDYTLFIIERFREERRHGAEKLDAIAAAGGSAGRAVLFAGMTVVVALFGLTIVPNSIFRSLSAGAIIVAAVAVAAALTLLPAILSVMGDRVNALRVPFIGHGAGSDHEAGFWAAIGRAVMGKPVVSVVASVGLLAAMAIPYFSIELGQAGVSTLPRNVEAFRGYEILDREFTAGLIDPARVVIDTRDVEAADVRGAIGRLEERLAADDAFGSTSFERNVAGDLGVLSVAVNGDPQSNEAHAALRRLRREHIPAAFAGVEARTYVTGPTANVADHVQVIKDYTPAVFAFVLGMSFIVLLLVFRSIVVPMKAMIMNLLSVGAAYGALVAVFQEGFLTKLFGFRQVDRIEGWLPLFLFAVLFGLSMDYHVFLLSRIRERYDETRDNAGSVAFGLRSTAGIITGAALIMVAVFSGFALGELSAFQQMGFGLAVAVILDATIVRSVLVPASMVLLGDWNWYLPSWLRWLPEVRIEGGRREKPSFAAGRFAGAGGN